MAKDSQISGFYKLSPEERLEKVKEYADLTDEDCELLANCGSLDMKTADRMIENVFSTYSLPLGVATNFQINNKDYIVPMVLEEPSVVAAASNLAKIARIKGGFTSETTDPIMIGQIQLITNNPEEAEKKILENKDKLIEHANTKDPVLVKYGGGVKGIETHIRKGKKQMVITHLLVDCRDAMGANAVNTMCESVAPIIEELTGGKVFLRIISNLAIHRLVKTTAVFDKEALGGESVVDAILDAYDFAVIDPFRAATHNKGIMNGVDAVILATGNDFRAIEAGAHAYAAFEGNYKPLTSYEKDSNGDLVGTLEMPVALGTVGGATRVHPVAKLSLKILGNPGAEELGQVIGAVGLAQNAAAMRALATEGIQRGHMRLHAKNLAATAGAEGDLIDKVAEQMAKEGKISVSRAEEILKELK